MIEEFLNPQKILKMLPLQKKMIAADFGSGSGGWAIPLAKILDKGKVYAIDILQEPLSALRGRAKLEGLANIITLREDVEEGTSLPAGKLDLVLMTNLLFQVENNKKVLEEAKRVLKEGGRILIVDWFKDNPLTKRIEFVDFEKIKKIAKDLNLELEKEFEAGSYHKGLIFVKI